jgi:hypothetical protein
MPSTGLGINIGIMATQLIQTGVQFPDNTIQTTAYSGSGLTGIRMFTTAGANQEFIIPAGTLKITLMGGGGGGSTGRAGWNKNSISVGSYGATGGIAIKLLTGLTAGRTLLITVGAGGTAGLPANGNPSAGTGGTSSVASGTQPITTVSATGGGGGRVVPNGSNSTVFGANGVPGIGVGGDLNIEGGGSTKGLNSAYYAPSPSTTVIYTETYSQGTYQRPTSMYRPYGHGGFYGLIYGYFTQDPNASNAGTYIPPTGGTTDLAPESGRSGFVMIEW